VPGSKFQVPSFKKVSLEMKDKKPETRDLELGTWNLEPGTWNLELESPSSVKLTALQFKIKN
jgi:hypothetical protein